MFFETAIKQKHIYLHLGKKKTYLWSIRKTLKWTKPSSVCIHLPATRQFMMLKRLRIAAKLNGSTVDGTDRSDTDVSDVLPSLCLINWFWQHSTPRLVFLCRCRNLRGVSSKTRLNCGHISHLRRAVSDRRENKVGILFKHRRCNKWASRKPLSQRKLIMIMFIFISNNVSIRFKGSEFLIYLKLGKY